MGTVSLSSGGKSPCNRSRIVLVESHDDTRELYAEYLLHCGFAVATHALTDTAVADAATADAVVTGIGVQGSMDGIEFVRALRHAPKTARTPILVVTAYVQNSVRASALKAGATVFLGKPCMPEDLARAIRRAIVERPVTTPPDAPNVSAGVEQDAK